MVNIEEKILQCLLEHEINKDTGYVCKHCSLAGHPALFRCRDCWNSDVLCQTCLIKEHKANPFHFAEKWTGSYFKRVNLSDLGLVIHLGHGRSPCPNASVEDKQKLKIVDRNGIQTGFILYCSCPGHQPKCLQLLEHQLFPASAEQPHTAFTFQVLKHFHAETTCSRTTAYDYIKQLQKLTDGIAPQNVTNVYREFLRTARLWRHLMTKKRLGITHGIWTLLPKSYQDLVCILCPACPHPGINISAHEQTDYRSALFISIDGNFGLKHKKSASNSDDPALSDGTAYFPFNAEYLKYLKAVKNDEEVSTCNCSKIIESMFQNKPHYDVTGIIAIVCSRHGFFWPHGTVDLQKGERFCNADYALAGVLQIACDVKRIFASYDIACGFCKKIRLRFEEYFPDLLHILDRITFLIPKMHLLGHQELCRQLFSFNLTEGAGRTDGEVIERVWAQYNELIRSTREMTYGHRHDVMNDHHSSLNFEKMINLGRS
ncbi:uncharacterized protein LAESUDRAFT_663379 [Laetiporus sulphureus 93-53]|uniref:CxC2-like cysteine cluster KDZ transposase-associated domain-containing protein n=1 Tax=Laetiporus sulphureus 93-53 TaxID=1314785 RepID=A0A165BVD9_9APHY|nr:uncharacterized protein LAESUDRAFT_663379 [Laetiporus sulphureus 93-53]KZT01724.1 hypothetical protein LAESUDRAFT_663379 [Laetiporus sulphureus 93-53]